MPPSRIELVCPTADERVDRWLAEAVPSLSRTQIKRLIQSGDIFVADQVLKANSVLPTGTVVVVNIPEPEPRQPVAQNIPLDILYEDESLVVVNKPAGLVVHQGVGHRSHTLVNALLYRYPDIHALDPERPGIVHRLDKDTSGLLVVARTETALHHLQNQFKVRSVRKIYQTLVQGHPQTPTGLIDVPIGRHPQHRQKMAPMKTGKPAKTRFSVLQKFNQHTLLEVSIETGRTHQIRVHLAWLGYPVVGDLLYGKRDRTLSISRQFLHACSLQFVHPSTEATISFETPLPEELDTILQGLSTRNF
ncbi:MAG: RluA family pseudouridine synthase [Chloroflexota bacterium]